MAASLSDQTGQTVEIWITAFIEAEYARRGVFPNIRRENAVRFNSHRGEYKVSLAEARSIYEDAREQRNKGRSRAEVGLSIAYNATASRLHGVANPKPEAPAKQDWLFAASLLSDERFANARRDERLCTATKDALESSPARLRVGDKALLDRGGEVEVVEDFGAYTVKGLEHYRFGYVVRHQDGERYFYPAAALTGLDGRPAHLRLVR